MKDLWDDGYNKAVEVCRERYLAACLLTKADRNRVGDLDIDIANEYTRHPGTGLYPKTVTKAYEILVKYRARPQRNHNTCDKGGVVFVTYGNQSNNYRNGGRAQGRSGREHGPRRCGGRAYPSQSTYLQEDDTQFLLDSINNLKSDIEPYIDVLSVELMLQQSKMQSYKAG